MVCSVQQILLRRRDTLEEKSIFPKRTTSQVTQYSVLREVNKLGSTVVLIIIVSCGIALGI